MLGVARVAGIMGVKRTSDLIPMCHPLPIQKCSVDFETKAIDKRMVMSDIHLEEKKQEAKAEISVLRKNNDRQVRKKY